MMDVERQTQRRDKIHRESRRSERRVLKINKNSKERKEWKIFGYTRTKEKC